MASRGGRIDVMLTASLLAVLVSTQSNVGKITVQLDQPGREISPTFYGLMTEEINHSYDGGLYAELIQNRALKDNPTSPDHWSLVQRRGSNGAMLLASDSPVPGTALDRCLKLINTSTGEIGVANDGYWGIPVKPNTEYRAAFYAKADGFRSLHLSIESSDGAQVYASGQVQGLGDGWRKYTLKLKTGQVAATQAARFALSTSGVGTLWLTQVSLFPPTYKNRVNGNRIDLMQKLIAMKPSFLRFPGGNYLEGNTISERFNWKETLGPIETRPGHQGPWGYRSSDGMGMLEFLEWCEDMKAQPVLAVFAGFSLGRERVSSGPRLAGFVQDALDEIEYVTGDASTQWGARRIKDGHPAPFKLSYVEVGNEDWSGTQYDERFTAFFDAIRQKYPKLKIIATAEVQSRVPDLVDDHYYRKSRVMMSDSGHYDSANRSGHKTFVGEWASTDHTPWSVVPANPTPTHMEALGDAAWLVGLERNADHVLLQCYAPLLTNINPKGAQWGVNLIGYDGLTSYGSPSYYVQSMFANYTGTRSVPVKVESNLPAVPEPMSKGAIGVGTWNTDAEYKDFVVSGPMGKPMFTQSVFGSDLSNWRLGKGTWEVHDGALRQSAAEMTDTLATVGNVNWQDYTLRLKARKLGGTEGFMVCFHCDADGHRWQWNIGGWSNTRTAFQRIEDGNEESGNSSNFKVETGRWYDLEIQVKGNAFRGYIDGKLVTERTGPTPSASIFAAASRSGYDIFLKVVNASAVNAPLELDLAGVGFLGKEATGKMLVGDPTEKNSITEPERIAPRPVLISAVGSKFSHEFPAHSVTVLRFMVGR